MIKKIIFLGVMISFLFSSTALVQGGDQESYQDEKRRQRLERETEEKVIEGKGKLLIDWGGSLEYSYESNKDRDNNWEQYDTESHTSIVDMEPWIKLSIRPEWSEDSEESSEHILYCRFLDEYNWIRPIDTYNGDNNEGPKVDTLYLDLDLDPIWIKGGRQFFELGTGITYANMHDGMKVSLAWKDWPE